MDHDSTGGAEDTDTKGNWEIPIFKTIYLKRRKIGKKPRSQTRGYLWNDHLMLHVMESTKLRWALKNTKSIYFFYLNIGIRHVKDSVQNKIKMGNY